MKSKPKTFEELRFRLHLRLGVLVIGGLVLFFGIKLVMALWPVFLLAGLVIAYLFVTRDR